MASALDIDVHVSSPLSWCLGLNDALLVLPTYGGVGWGAGVIEVFLLHYVGIIGGSLLGSLAI